MEDIGDPSKPRVIKIPPVQVFRSLGAETSPLLRFYNYVAMSIGCHTGVKFRPTRFLMSKRDGRALYTELRKHVEEHFDTQDVGTETSELWKEMAPKVSDEVIEGQIVLLDGYIFIS